MGPVYEFLGLATGYIGEGMSAAARQQAYAADITYLTAKESGFDYLRNFLCVDKEQLLTRLHLCAACQGIAGTRPGLHCEKRQDQLSKPGPRARSRIMAPMPSTIPSTGFLVRITMAVVTTAASR